MKYVLNGTIHYDGGTFVLTNGDKKVGLNPGAGRALAFMLANSGRECRKDELVEEIWGKHGFVVGSNSLNQIIVQLRRGLEAVDPGSEYIVTIPRVGYKFVAEVGGFGPQAQSVDSYLPEPPAQCSPEQPQLRPTLLPAIKACQQIGKTSRRVLDRLQGLLVSGHLMLIFAICAAAAFASDVWVGPRVDPIGESFSVVHMNGSVRYYALLGMDPQDEKRMEAAFDRYVAVHAKNAGRTHVYLLGGAESTFLACRAALPARRDDCSAMAIGQAVHAPALEHPRERVL